MTKVAVVGIDAASFDLIEHWKDFLPNLNKMIKKGVHGVLRSTTPPDSSPAWACFYTGKNPGKIGVYGFVNINDDGTTSIVDYTSCDSLAIWEILSRFGKRVCVLNVPVTYPPREVNGYMIAGFSSPFSRKDYTFPPYLYKELDRIVGGYQTDVIYSSTEEAGEEKFLAELSRVHEKTLKAAKHLLRKEKWDFFMVVFREIDYVQHYFWKYMYTKNHTDKEKYANVIRDWYIKIDRALGEVKDELDDDTYVIVMSDHGCEAARYEIYINEWLRQQGLLKFLKKKEKKRKNLSIRLRKFILEYFSPYLIKKFLRVVPQRFLIKATLRGVIKQDIDQIFSNIDWRRTKVYALGGTNASLYTLKRRGHPGIINHSKEYEDIRTKIIEGLQILRTESDKKIFATAVKKEELYWGKHADIAPDLAVDFFIDGSKCFVNTKTGHGKILNEISVHGIHSSKGTWLATGPKVERNMRIDTDIIDLAPTILYLLDIPIPKDMDGKIIREGFSLTRNPQYQKAIVSKIKSQSAKSASDERELKKRLQALGYLG